MTVPQVSVIMSVRNGAAYLAEALDSLLQQTLADIEIVLIDNGSRDATPEIIASYDDPRIRVLRNPVSLTLTEALNQGLAAARAPLIARLDADDIALVDRLEYQKAYLDAHPGIAAIGTGWEEFGPDGGILAKDDRPMAAANALDCFAADQPLVHSSLMARTDAVRAVGGYPPAYVYAQDFALYIELLRAGHTVEILPRILVRIRAHPGQASRSGAWAVDRTREALLLFQRVGGLPGLSRQARRRNHIRVAEARFRYGMALLFNGGGMKGLAEMLLGVGSDPALPFRLAVRRFRHV